jgi:hypothetical protein
LRATTRFLAFEVAFLAVVVFLAAGGLADAAAFSGAGCDFFWVVAGCLGVVLGVSATTPTASKNRALAAKRRNTKPLEFVR